MSITFETTFHAIIEEITSEEPFFTVCPDALIRLKEALLYNVPHITELRCGIVTAVYKGLIKRPLSKKEEKMVLILGVLTQMVQTFLGVLDDLVDGGDKRFGKPTWIKLHDKIPIVSNDILLMEHATYRLLFKYFGDQPMVLSKLIKYTFETVYENTLANGQHLLTTETFSKRFSIENFERFSLINNRFTTPLTIHIPMILAGYSENSRLWKIIEKISSGLVLFRTISDDLMDSFPKGSSNKTTDGDICTGKITWLMVKARSLCNDKEWSLLENAYGTDNIENISLVKNVFLKLNIPKLCEEYLIELKFKILNDISELQMDWSDLADTLQSILEKLSQLLE